MRTLLFQAIYPWVSRADTVTEMRCAGMFVLTALLLGCRHGAPPSSAFAPAPAPSQSVADPSASSPTHQSSAKVGWSVYREARGCTLNLYDAPRVIADAATLQSLLVAQTPDCNPAATASAFDFTAHRLIVERVGQGAFNPNTRETIVPVAVTLDSDPIVVSIDLPPNCGGADNGPGFIVLVVPAGGGSATVQNRNRTNCGYGSGPRPA